MRRYTLPAVLALMALLGAAIAHAELTQKGGLRVAFDGRFVPHALPRDRPAPVTVRIDGSVSTVDGSRPPQLRRISIALNRNGRLFTRGLPTCSAGMLQSTSTEAALSRCRPALVGHGRFAVNLDFLEAPLIPAEGTVLAFNGRARGRPVILLHLYGSSPVRASFVLPFKISRRANGDFGTVFSTRIPKIASDLGYVTDIELTVGRRFRYRGRLRSFLSASCAAPAGFSSAIFGFAEGSFVFANGQELRTTLIRDCRVR